MENSKPNMRCIAKACDNLGISYTVKDDYGNWIAVHLSKDYHFVNNKIPFNDGGINSVCRNKEYTYRLIKDEINTPRTKGYFDPKSGEDSAPYVLFDSVKKIKDDIIKEFGLPVMIKRNSGTKGVNIFLAKTPREVTKSLKKVFDKSKKSYDTVALAQEPIDILREVRIVWFLGEPVIMYEKVTPDGKKESISPMFNSTAYTRPLEDEEPLRLKIQEFLNKSSVLKTLEYAGIDLAVDQEGQLWIIEINAYPILTKLARDYGDSILVQMYENIIKILKER